MWHLKCIYEEFIKIKKIKKKNPKTAYSMLAVRSPMLLLVKSEIALV